MHYFRIGIPLSDVLNRKRLSIMSMSLVILIILLGIIFVSVVIISIKRLNGFRNIDERDCRNLHFSERPTHFLDDSGSEKPCSVCLGRIGNNEIAICSCGRISHKDCAFSIGGCPYCNAPFDDSTVRPAKTTPCPVCGKNPGDGVCGCGTVYPGDDGSIICSCGNSFQSHLGVCDRCGNIYESGRLRQPSQRIKIKTKN